MFGPQPAPQPVQRLSWQDYLDRIKNGPAPQYSPPSQAQQPQGPGTAAGFPGGSGGSNSGGPYPAGLINPASGGGIMAGKNSGGGSSMLPATPVDYGRMHSILNSGVLEGGHAPTSVDIAAAPQTAPTPPPAPTPAAQPQNPFQNFLTTLMDSVNQVKNSQPDTPPANGIPPGMVRTLAFSPNDNPPPAPVPSLQGGPTNGPASDQPQGGSPFPPGMVRTLAYSRK